MVIQTDVYSNNELCFVCRECLRALLKWLEQILPRSSEQLSDQQIHN